MKTYNNVFIFFFNDTPTTEIYTLSLHDALPIYRLPRRPATPDSARSRSRRMPPVRRARDPWLAHSVASELLSGNVRTQRSDHRGRRAVSLAQMRASCRHRSAGAIAPCGVVRLSRSDHWIGAFAVVTCAATADVPCNQRTRVTETPRAVHLGVLVGCQASW